MQENAKSQSPPTSRVVAVLDALAEAQSGGMSSSQIARAVGLSTSTTASILAALEAAGYVERLPNRDYLLGSGLLRLLGGLRARYPLLGAADEELSRLAEVAGCGCTLSRITEEDLEVILTVGRVDEFAVGARHRLPIYPPFGSVAMAWRSAERIDEWLSSAPDPMTPDEVDELHSSLREIRERCYAVYNIRRDVRTMVTQMAALLSSTEEHAPPHVLRSLVLSAMTGAGVYNDLASRRQRSVSYVLAPVFGPDQQPRNVVALHVMRDAVPPDDLDKYIDAIVHTATTLTKISGGRWPAA